MDELVVAILRNSDKGTPLFSVPEREEMIREATQGFGNVRVGTFDGLLIDYARKEKAKAVLDLADQVALLELGRAVWSGPRSAVDHNDLVATYLGRSGPPLATSPAPD